MCRGSRAARTTIYRHWTSKSELLVEALESLAEDKPAFRSSGNVRQDLMLIMGGFAEDRAAGPFSKGLLPALLDAAERELELARIYDAFVAKRSVPLRIALQGSIAAGSCRRAWISTSPTTYSSAHCSIADSSRITSSTAASPNASLTLPYPSSTNSPTTPARRPNPKSDSPPTSDITESPQRSIASSAMMSDVRIDRFWRISADSVGM